MTTVQHLVAQWQAEASVGGNPAREAELAERIRKARLAARRRTSTHRLAMAALAAIGGAK